MGVIIDFAKEKQRQTKEVQKVLKEIKQKEDFYDNFLQKKSKYKKIKSKEKTICQEYQIDKYTTIRINPYGGYTLTRINID